MRMEQLRCLVDISETGNITLTAQRLFMTQQAVSRRIKQLEETLGIELLVRTNSGVLLTEAGKDVVESAKIILQEEARITDNIKHRVQKYANAEKTEIRIASTSAVTNIVLPQIIAKSNKMQHKVSFKIFTYEDIDALLEQVQSGACHIGLVTFHEEELRRKIDNLQKEIAVEILARDEIVTAMSKNTYVDLKARYNIGEATLNLEQLPNTEGLPILTTYNLLATQMSKSHTEKYITVASNDAEFHRNMIDKVGAVVVMPSLAYKHFFSNKKYVSVPMGDDVSVPMAHAAVLLQDRRELLEEFLMAIRTELLQ